MHFKSLVTICTVLSGTSPKLLDIFVTNQEKYHTCNKQDKQEQMKKDTFYKWMLFLLIKVSDQSKYVTLSRYLYPSFLWGISNTQRPLRYQYMYWQIIYLTRSLMKIIKKSITLTRRALITKMKIAI